MSGEPVKTCPGCGRDFTLEELISDPRARPEGLTFEDGEPAHNLFFFTHTVPECGTTFVVPVEAFLTVIDEPVPDRIMTGTEVCERHCTRISDWAACSQACFHAPFRRFLLSMLERKRAMLPDEA